MCFRSGNDTFVLVSAIAGREGKRERKKKKKLLAGGGERKERGGRGGAWLEEG